MYSTFKMIRNVLPLACIVSFHPLKAVILLLLSTGSAKSVSLPFYRNRSLELFYLYPDNAPTIMFSIFSDMEISEMLIPRNIYKSDFFLFFQNIQAVFEYIMFLSILISTIADSKPLTRSIKHQCLSPPAAFWETTHNIQ